MQMVDGRFIDHKPYIRKHLTQAGYTVCAKGGRKPDIICNRCKRIINAGIGWVGLAERIQAGKNIIEHTDDDCNKYLVAQILASENYFCSVTRKKYIIRKHLDDNCLQSTRCTCYTVLPTGNMCVERHFLISDLKDCDPETVIAKVNSRFKGVYWKPYSYNWYSS